MADQHSLETNINTHSRPSELKITDMRICNLRGLPMDCTILRLDTNQGISGYGEVRDWASPTFALMLKNRIIGENPCNIDLIFRKLKQFGYHARQGGGVSGIEMALFDLAGKAYGVPAYQLLGGKFRDKVLCYCDTDSVANGQQMGERLKRRMERGFKFLKMDIGISLLMDVPDALSGPPDMLHTTDVMHPFTGIQITPTGIDFLVEYVRQVRAVIGYQVPLAVDHFGHINLESCIRLGQALDQFTLAWYEDMIPWQFTDQYVRLSQSVNTPICTGEDIYLKDGFRPLLEKRGVSVIHPDLATAGSPISFLANIHCAAATENFYVLENHSVDLSWWDDLVDSGSKPFVKDGYAAVPESPGLGFDAVSEAAFRERIDDRRQGGFFDSSAEWDAELSHDRLWS